MLFGSRVVIALAVITVFQIAFARKTPVNKKQKHMKKLRRLVKPNAAIVAAGSLTLIAPLAALAYPHGGTFGTGASCSLLSDKYCLTWLPGGSAVSWCCAYSESCGSAYWSGTGGFYYSCITP